MNKMFEKYIFEKVSELAKTAPVRRITHGPDRFTVSMAHPCHYDVGLSDVKFYYNSDGVLSACGTYEYNGEFKIDMTITPDGKVDKVTNVSMSEYYADGGCAQEKLESRVAELEIEDWVFTAFLM